jgi:type IV pilus assembly protein PilW
MKKAAPITRSGHGKVTGHRWHGHGQLRAQGGLSLIELLVALLLSATLMAGVVGVFLGMFQSDRSQEGVSLMQEGGRFAVNFLAQDIRMAGYLGCSSTLDKSIINNTLDGPPPSFQPERSVQGWEANGTDPGDISNSVNNLAVASTAGGGWSTSGGNVLDTTMALPGTDIFRIWGADTSVDSTIISVSPGAATIVEVNADAGVGAGDILLLSDCEKADWVQACTTSEIGNPPTMNLVLSAGCTPGNVVNAPLLVGAGARMMKLAGTMYYIGKRGDVSTNPPALFRRRLGTTGAAGTPEELVEGVENMQVLYGENTDNDSRNAADRFVPADQVADWDDVVSVRITLLMQSLENNLVPDPASYTFNGVVYDSGVGNGALPPDGRLRRVFTTTMNLRNITLGG